jgi:hypothetical protein
VNSFSFASSVSFAALTSGMFTQIADIVSESSHNNSALSLS